MKVFSQLFAIFLALAILLFGISIAFPDIFPLPTIEAVGQFCAQIFYGAFTQQNHLPTGTLEELQADGELITGGTLTGLEDSGITGEGYTFDPVYHLYYTFLTDEERDLYAQAYANVVQMHTTFIPVTAITAEGAENAITALFYDHPELFWLEMDYRYSYTSDGNCVQIILEFNETADSIESAKQTFESRATSIIIGALSYSTAYEKEKYVHNALADRISYNIDTALNQSSYSALVYGETVCAGYAKAFQYIMNRLEIPTYFCAGYADGDHAWNIVRLEDGYYNVDLTWNDASSSYQYFNQTDSDFRNTHTRTGLSQYLPACTATEYRHIAQTTAQESVNVSSIPSSSIQRSATPQITSDIPLGDKETALDTKSKRENGPS